MKNKNEFNKIFAENFVDKSEMITEDALQVATVEAVADIVAKYVQKREELGITQASLASITGIKQSAISRLESFRAVPQLDTILKLLKPLGLSLAIVKEEN